LFVCLFACLLNHCYLSRDVTTLLRLRTVRYCRGEAALALNHNKPVYVIVPPLSEAEQVTSLDALPEAMGKTLSERQFFNVSHGQGVYADELRGLVVTLKESKEAALLASPGHYHHSGGGVDASHVDTVLVFHPDAHHGNHHGRTKDETNINSKSTNSSSTEVPVHVLPSPSEYIFLCCGQRRFKGHFCEALKNALVAEGESVAVGAVGHNFSEVSRTGCSKCLVWR